MAYKFQFGAATLSGSVTLKQSATMQGGFSNNDENITNVGNIAVDSISADAGNLSIALADNVAASLDIKEGNNSYMKFDSTDGSEEILVSKPFKLLDDLALVFGTDSDARIEYDENGSDQLRISAPAAGVVIAGAAPSLTIGDAGAEDTKIVFDGNAQDYYIGLDDTDDIFKIGRGSAVGTNPAITIDASGDAVVEGSLSIIGNLTIEGTTTTVNSSTIAITSSFTFEGATPDAHETVLGVTDPTADATINLPAMSAGTYHVPVLASVSTTAITATPAEINLIDGGTARGTTALSSGDGFLHNDAGTMRMTSIDKIADLFAGEGLVAASGVMAVQVSGGINLANDKIGLSGSVAGNGLSFTGDHSHVTTLSVDADPDSFSVSGLGLQLAANVAGNGLALASGALSLDVDEMAELAAAPHATQDFFPVSDNGTEKKVTMTNVANGAFALVSGDATIAAGGALTIAATSVENGMLAGSIADSKLNQIATAGKVALSALEIDGESNAVTTLADADLFIVDDGAGGSNKKMAASVLKSYVAADVQAVALKDDSGTLAVGVNYFADHAGNETVALPASSGLLVGQSIKIKAGSDCDPSRKLTITRAGSQTIDGETSIVLESPFAAVELIYVASDLFRVF